MVAALPDDLPGVRDKAILLIGVAGAFRRSEIRRTAAARYSDRRCWPDRDAPPIKDGSRRLKFHHRHSHRNQRRDLPEVRVGILAATCGHHQRADFSASGSLGHVGSRALRRLGVARAVKHALAAIDMDATNNSGHSLCAGLVTAAAMARVSARVIMQQTGRKNAAMLRRSICEGSLFRENAAAAVGLYVLLLEATARKSGGWLYHVR